MKKRVLYIDVLRIAACLAVIFNHTADKGFYLFSTRAWGSIPFYVDLTASICCKFAVPTFFAISGALMLEKEIKIAELWTKRIFRMVSLLVVFSALSYTVDTIVAGEALSMKKFLLRGYEDNLNHSYWYLYSYIGYLIGLPMLGSMLRNMRTREIEYMLCVALLFKSILPAAEQLIWSGTHHLNSDLDMGWLVSNIVLYPSLGYYLHNRVDEAKGKKLLPCLVVVSAAGMGISCILTYRAYSLFWTPYIQNYHDLFSGVYAAAIFLAIRQLVGDYGVAKHTGWIALLGRYTLGIYLLHVMIMDHIWLFREGLWTVLETCGFPSMVNCGIYVSVVFVVCAFITAVLKRVPGFKWMLS